MLRTPPSGRDRQEKQTKPHIPLHKDPLVSANVARGFVCACCCLHILHITIKWGGIGANCKPVLGEVRAFNVPGDTCKQYGVPGAGSRGHPFSVWYMGNDMGSARHTMLSFYVVCLGSVTQEWSTILSGDVCARRDIRAMFP